MAQYAIITDGLVSNIAEADESFAADQGWIAAPEGVSIGWTYGSDGFAPPPPRPGTVAGVIAERARRLAVGFDYDFGDDRGVHHIGTTDEDMIGWDEVSKGAQAAIALGHPESPIAIVTDTGAVSVTALEWQAVLAAATAARQPIWQASFVLQTMNPIPGNFADDAWWSSAGE